MPGPLWGTPDSGAHGHLRFQNVPQGFTSRPLPRGPRRHRWKTNPQKTSMHGYPRRNIFFSLEIVCSFQHHRPSWWTREREQKGGCLIFLKLEPVKTRRPGGLCSRVALSALPPSPPLWREGALVLCSLSYSLQLSEQKLRLLLHSCSCLPEGYPWGLGLKSSPLPPLSSSHLRSRAPQF